MLCRKGFWITQTIQSEGWAGRTEYIGFAPGVRVGQSIIIGFAPGVRVGQSIFNKFRVCSLVASATREKHEFHV